MKPICLFLLTACLLSASPVAAQLGLHGQFLSQSISSQQYQPALLMFQDFKHVAVEVEGAYWLGANTFTLDGIFSDGNYLSEASKDKIIGQLSDNNRFQMGSAFGVHANLRAAGLHWSFSYRNLQSDYFEVGDPNSVGLVLYGNARYAGDTISDDHIAIRQHRYTELAAGTGFQMGRVRLGIRGKVLLGKELYAVDELSYSLYTATDGAMIAVKSQYDIFDTQGSGPQGWGLAADIGAIYDNDENLRIQASLINMGFLTWEGNRLNQRVDFTYEGINARSFIGTRSTSDAIVLADTIQALLFPDTLAGQLTALTPAVGHVGIRYFLTERDQLMVSASQTFGRFAPNAKLPLINVAYHRNLGKALTLGANLYSGGYDILGAGLLAQVKYQLGDAFGIQAFCYMDNALGLIAPTIGQGISVNGGIGIWH